MSIKFFLALIILLIASCSPTKIQKTKCFKKKRTISSIYWTEKFVIDNYIKLRKENYFNYYQRFLGSEKMIEYRGSYSQLGDTVFFRFCGDTIPKLLTEKVLINKSKNEITLLSTNPNLIQHFKITINYKY